MKSWLRSKKLPSVALSLALLAVMTVSVAYSPTLYRWFCSVTGYGGTVTVNRSTDIDSYAESQIGPAIKVRLDANISPHLDWDFRPETTLVETHIGLPTTVFYIATNRSKETLVGRATYNVTPNVAGFYFTKTACFCFDEQKLAPGESARMPVVFYVDPEMVKDIDARGIRTITLSYTFFKLESDAASIASAQNLREVGEKNLQMLEDTKQAEFEPPQPKRQ